MKQEKESSCSIDRLSVEAFWSIYLTNCWSFERWLELVSLTSMKPFCQFDVGTICFHRWKHVLDFKAALLLAICWRVRFHRWKHDSVEVPNLENFLKILYSWRACFHRWKNEDVYFPSMELCWGERLHRWKHNLMEFYRGRNVHRWKTIFLIIYNGVAY